MAYQCEDCRTVWDSQRAADECATIDAAEARNARRPNPKTMRPMARWEND